MTRTVNIHEAKTHLSRLLDDVRRGETVIIAKAGEPVAQLTALPQVDLVFGGMVGEFGPGLTDEAWESSERDVLEMWDDDLELDR